MSTKPKKRQLPPDDPDCDPGMNDMRSDWALAALDRFAVVTGSQSEPPETNAADFLADLAHYCDRHQMSLSLLLAHAKTHYEAETQYEGTQFNFL